MRTISKNQTYNKADFLYVASRALERASFYGLRSILALYMINSSIALPEEDAIKFYGWFVSSFLFSQIFGAILGDLVFGNKKTIIIGGILQAIGTFMLCIPSINNLYIGIVLISVGSGFYSPNILARYGKLYLNKPELMDAGYTMFYCAINIGAFMGVALIGYLGYENYIHGFITAGILMVLSVGMILLSKENEEAQSINYTEKNSSKRILIITGSILIVGLYWFFFDYTTNDLLFIQNQIEISALGIPTGAWMSYSTSFVVIVATSFCIIWSYIYSSSLAKMASGFFIAAVAFGILLFIPENVSSLTLLILIISIFLLSIAEILIGPILYSILTKNTNPKYLAIIISLSFIPFNLVMFLSLSNSENSVGFLSFKLAAIILGLLGMFLFGILVIRNKKFI